ncbi:holo-ACP synthase [Pseudalkalibacillus sp. SCS-8]|uniref:holo-ACP synthase n=1 Tax=Pseudalkalibacillus nanhaiensis TaxID=3115291 RepID=UPI0032DB1EB3
MITGIGIDIVEIERIRKTHERQPKFAQRVLTRLELDRFQSFKGRKSMEFLAGRFAAKEAYAKAVGTGIGKHLSWQDIEIMSDENGKPTIHSQYDGVIHVSISHSNEYAVAQVILESSSS